MLPSGFWELCFAYIAYTVYVIYQSRLSIWQEKYHREINSKHTNVIFVLIWEANRLNLTETYTVGLYFMVYFQIYHFNCRVFFYFIFYLFITHVEQPKNNMTSRQWLYIHVYYLYITPHHLSVWHRWKTYFRYCFLEKMYSPTTHIVSPLLTFFHIFVLFPERCLTTPTLMSTSEDITAFSDDDN